MNAKKLFTRTLIVIITASFISSLLASSSQAASKNVSINVQMSLKNLLRVSDPGLQCAGSGELSGSHPGWSSLKAISATMVNLPNGEEGVYWCPATAPSGKGLISYTVTSLVGANTCESVETNCVMSGVINSSALTIMATDQTGSYPINGLAVMNSGVVNTCLPGSSQCDVANASTTFPTYGNDGATAIKDCTFAAVANWEQVALGVKPNPVQINSDFAKSGGAKNGLTNDQVFAFWSSNGIDGVHLKGASSQALDPVTLQTIVGDSNFKAVIAQLGFSYGQSFAGNQMSGPSYHWVVIDGYTPTGPLAISWGKTLQMMWQQWNAEAVSMWTIAVRN